MLSTCEWLTFFPTNTTSRKWLATPLRHDATLTKSRSDVSHPTDAFRNICLGGQICIRNIVVLHVDAKLLNRASLHRVFRVGATVYVPNITAYLQDIY
jgi:hypothetical protein